MLQDKDRIFTNLYCQDDWRLEGARVPELIIDEARTGASGAG